MNHDPIFQTLRAETLEQIAEHLNWNPTVSASPAKVFSQLDTAARRDWLDVHRPDLEEHISWVGTPMFSFALGNGKSYSQIVADLAQQLGVEVATGASAAEVEVIILEKLWSDTLARLTVQQREELLSKITEQFGTSVGKELLGFAGLASAQLSGFGVYVLGSTLLGALNSALGLGLGFGVFTGLSSVISLVIGPIGWAALGLYTIRKLGGPNYKKLLPVVILVASERVGGSQQNAQHLASPHQPESTKVASASLTIPEAWKQHRKVSSSKPVNIIPTKAFRRDTPVLTYSKREKTAFRLRPENRELCTLTEEFFPGSHFLDVSDTDQQAILEIQLERAEAEREATRTGREPKQVQSEDRWKERKREETSAQSSKNLKLDEAVGKRSQQYARLLRNLEFDTAAVERIELLAMASRVSQIDEKLGLMNAGQVIYRESIPDTQPKTYEAKAGYDYRIYYYRNGAKVRIRMVGDKGTQESDINQLRRKAASQAAVSK
jgi:uncharacterized protein YaaW (UPF0174 family)